MNIFAPDERKQAAGRKGAAWRVRMGVATHKSILSLLAASGAVRVVDVARHISRTPSAAHQHLQRIVRDGQAIRQGVRYKRNPEPRA